MSTDKSAGEDEGPPGAEHPGIRGAWTAQLQPGLHQIPVRQESLCVSTVHLGLTLRTRTKEAASEIAD